MFGQGLLSGMWFTLKAFFKQKDTVEYPDVKIPMTPRFRGGVIALDHEKCIACGLCAMSCPNQAIKVISEKTEGNKKQLTDYEYLAEYCLYCNLCMEACPTQAICWDKNYEIATYHRESLIFDCLSRSKAKAGQSASAKEPQIGNGEGGSNLGG